MANTNNQAIKITELESASNLESGDLVLIAQKTGVDKYTTKKLDSSYINNLRTTASNLGSTGAQIFEGTMGGQTTPLYLRFRRIVAGEDIKLTQTGDSIYVSALSALKVATNAEVWSGMETNKAISPAGLASKTSSDNVGDYIVKRDYYGNFEANTITASLNGNASSSTQLQGLRRITLTGDVSGTIRTNFSNDIDINTTLGPSLLSSFQPINGSIGPLTLSDITSAIYFNDIPAGVKKITLVIESWTHTTPGQGIIQIGTTAESTISPELVGGRGAVYYGNVNGLSGLYGWSITGWADTSAEHIGTYNFYVATNPLNPIIPKKLICESKITQIDLTTNQISNLNGAGFIDYMGEVNQFVLKNTANQSTLQSVTSATATLYWYF